MSSPSASPLTSLTLDPRVIASNFAKNGTDIDIDAVAAFDGIALNSTNNFINYCLTRPNLALTNGTQLQTGSCNPVPIGMIPPSDHMPSVKFVFPTYGEDVNPNQPFEIKIAVRNLETGFNANTQTNFLSAPQQIDSSSKNIQGAVRIAIEQIASFRQKTPTDPRVFSFFKTIQDKAQDGVLSANITGGLTVGVYRISSMVTTTNRAAPYLPILAHGSTDDAVYITVGGTGRANGDNTALPESSSVQDTGNRFQPTPSPSGTQTSLTLDPNAIAAGLSNDGQDTPVAGQVASLTSTNNFINFCATANLPLTNGQQVKGGSCNPAPMGIIPPSDQMPVAKFTFPLNGDKISASSNFSVSFAVSDLSRALSINSNTNFMAAPQQSTSTGQFYGNVQFVIEKLTAFNQTEPTDPTSFQFFQGVTTGGDFSGPVTGLPAGFYRLSSLIVGAHYQPAQVALAQHGALNDVVYFEVTDDGSGVTSSPTSSAQPGASSGAGSNGVSGRSSDTSAIIGGVMGGIVFILLVVIAGILFRRRRRQQHQILDPNLDIEEAQHTSVIPFDTWTQRQPVSRFESVSHSTTPSGSLSRLTESIDPTPPPLPPKKGFSDIAPVILSPPVTRRPDVGPSENSSSSVALLPSPDTERSDRVSIAETAPPPYQF
ncbi:hypothetical protein HGRIS_002883 [Hohenbuehelia grisea]|uniref:Uncharacterized protein n=1 Tax=Hohenbuehelia grisea TaxID=104357 RepID=A0ABR3JLT8_9AGAR